MSLKKLIRETFQPRSIVLPIGRPATVGDCLCSALSCAQLSDTAARRKITMDVAAALSCDRSELDFMFDDITDPVPLDLPRYGVGAAA